MTVWVAVMHSISRQKLLAVDGYLVQRGGLKDGTYYVLISLGATRWLNDAMLTFNGEENGDSR